MTFGFVGDGVFGSTVSHPRSRITSVLLPTQPQQMLNGGTVGPASGNCSEQSCAAVFLMASHSRSSTIPKVTLLNRTVGREQLSTETVNDFFFFLFEQILTISGITEL